MTTITYLCFTANDNHGRFWTHDASLKTTRIHEDSISKKKWIFFANDSLWILVIAHYDRYFLGKKISYDVFHLLSFVSLRRKSYSQLTIFSLNKRICNLILIAFVLRLLGWHNFFVCVSSMLHFFHCVLCLHFFLLHH